jgi:hypothetical protein
MSGASTYRGVEVAVTTTSALRAERYNRDITTRRCGQAGVGLIVSTAEIRREESLASWSHSCGSSQDGPLSSVPNVFFFRDV